MEVLHHSGSILGSGQFRHGLLSGKEIRLSLEWYVRLDMNL